MNKKLISLLLGSVGMLLLFVSVIYILEPAKSLPTFLPGFDANLSRHHYTHAVASFILSLLCFSFVWFQTGKSSQKKKEN